MGAINKGLGLVATIAGALAGGALMAQLRLYRALMLFGVLQAVTTVTTATSDGESASVTTNEARRREQLSHHLVREIILTRSVQRFSITADKFNFSYLGERRTKSLPTNFTLLVRDLIQFAPHATLNHGAQLLRDNAAEVWSYPSKNAFTEEIIWMLWQMKKNPAA